MSSDGNRVVATAVDVARLVRTDARFSAWELIDRGIDYLEIVRDGAYVALAWPARWAGAGKLDVHLLRARSGNHHLVLMGSDDALGQLDAEQLDAPGVSLVSMPLSVIRLWAVLRSAWEGCRLRRTAARLELELDRARYENDMLISIGRALSQERSLRSLLSLILTRAREVTGADAGSIYVVDGDDDGDADRRVRFVVSQNDSIVVDTKEFSMPVSAQSIVGACVLSADVINIPDLYQLDSPGTGNNPWGFQHDRSFDQKYGYQTRSMLTVPMISARARVIGVIQLINKRARGQLVLNTPTCFESGVVPFDAVSESYCTTLGSQAGIALDNALLNDEVRTLFEGFVRASVTAIESRDPTTSGHSERVADLTVGLAEATDRVDNGAYAGLRFSADDLKQIEYAALLHDFGKVGVREHVLVKAKKLYSHQRDLILSRFSYIRQTLENEQLNSKVGYLLKQSREQTAAQLAARLGELEQRTAGRIAEIDEFIRFILQANEPSVLEQGGFERIADIAARTYTDREGDIRPYLTEEEASALQILRGSLTGEERAEIESHVVHTYKFLQQIPWGRIFRQIPEIAGAHHEKLDGSGYPHGLTGPQIPAPAKMMTISDIYDALTASDRPYKKAMPRDRALDILSTEVQKGRLDSELFQLFLEAQVYRRVEAD